MVSVTADSNIYISALNFGGPPDEFLDLARAGVIRLAISTPIHTEVAGILRLKFGWDEAAVLQAKERIDDYADHVDPKQAVEAVREDPSDNRILECAQAARSEYIVTGDKHLLKLGSFGYAKIVKPADFLRIHSALRS